jgi:hypothetical protein
MLWAKGFQGSTSVGGAGAGGLVVAPFAMRISDLYGTAVGIGGTIGFTGKSLGITADVWNAPTSGWYCDVGATAGPNAGPPLGELHGGFSDSQPVNVTPAWVNGINAAVVNWVNHLALFQWSGSDSWERSEGFQNYQRLIGVGVSGP